ncbi:MAG: JmjC domain-containing protein [Methylotenera sp.]|jgi:50S ribosomal protein L16 3-hydroxylase
MEKSLRLLNNLSPSQFLAEYWQKKPLLIRQAIPDFKGLLTPDELAGLACEEHVQSRIVKVVENQWSVDQGPFDEAVFSSLPDTNWSLLVQSVNHHLPEAADLLSQFNFIPHVRLDDLMVSYAPTDGSVGAHVDAYDVFLLQGSGKRRWRINTQADLTLIENAPLAILKHFEAEQEWILESGDMLYLPPNVAHHGIAEDDTCMTYSIGFRSPKAQELTHAFLEYLQDTSKLNGLYEDPDLTLQKHPAEISATMIKKVEAMLQKISWTEDSVADFLGRYMSEPKPDISFEPQAPISVDVLSSLLAESALQLDLQSQMLFSKDNFYINGESLNVPPIIVNCMQTLADTKKLNATTCNAQMRQAIAVTLQDAYNAGYIQFIHDDLNG